MVSGVRSYRQDNRAQHLVVGCPATPPQGLIPSRLSEKLQEADKVWSNQGAFAVGLEQRTAIAVARGLESRGLSRFQAPYRRFVERPAAEVAIKDKFPGMTFKSYSQIDIEGIAADLYGDGITSRCSPAYSSSTHTVTHFPDWKYAAKWKERYLSNRSAEAGAFGSACYAYAQVALNHPYSDGNGRLARALFSLELAAGDALALPVLPLGPVIYANRTRLVDSLIHLNSTGLWSVFLQVMQEMSIVALDYAIADRRAA